MDIKQIIDQNIIDNNEGLITPKMTRDVLYNISYLLGAEEWRPGMPIFTGKPIRFFNQLYVGLTDGVGSTTQGSDPNTGIPLAIGEDVAAGLLIAVGGAGGGGGGGGGGITTTTNILADGPLAMLDHPIISLADPRGGAAGAGDATNREWVEKAIASGALYQGTYQPVTNSPDLWAATDSGFTWPAPDTEISKPATTTHVVPAGDVAVWFDMTPTNWPRFPWTLTVPIPVDVWLSNGDHVTFNIAPQTFNVMGDFRAELRTHLAGTNISDFVVDVDGGDLWVGVETTPPVYPVYFSPSNGGGYPDAQAGAGNTVLNTYNWIVQTVDPNVAEVMPPGIPGIAAGVIVRNSDILQWNDNISAFEIIRGGQLTQAFADRRYWQVKGRNFEWRADDYPAGSVVLHDNVWYQATQQVTQADSEPGLVATAALWRKINASSGATTFFGAGEWDDDPDDDGTPGPLTAANNWGMPPGTVPSGQQPQDQDIYYDILSGSQTVFEVTKNQPIYTITGTVTLGQDSKGTLSLGGVAGRSNWYTFNADGQALNFAKDSYYTLIIPDDFTAATNAAASETWNSDADSGPLDAALAAVGDWIELGGDVTSASIGADYSAAWPATLQTGGAIIRIAAEDVYGMTNEGSLVVAGCVYVIPAVWAGIGGGTAYPQTWESAPQSGHFAGQAVPVGTHYVVWSGDSGADNGGWVLIDDTPPLDWTTNTSNPQTVPDTVTATREWGYARDFIINIPATVNEDDLLAVIDGIQHKTQLLRFELRAEEADGAVFEFEALQSGSTTLISPLAAISTNSYIKEIQVKERAADNSILVLKFTAAAAGKTLYIHIDSVDGYLGSLSSPLDAAAFDSNFPTINGLKDYPDPGELEAELIAQSTSADIQVPQYFSRSSISKNTNQTFFSLGVKPKRKLRGRFLAKHSQNVAHSGMLIGQLDGTWIDWDGHNRQGDAVVFHEWQDGREYKTQKIGDSNAGIYVTNEIQKDLAVFIDFEFLFMKEHTVLIVDSMHQENSVPVKLKLRQIWGESWAGKMNYIGFKQHSLTFDYVEAYIEWE